MFSGVQDCHLLTVLLITVQTAERNSFQLIKIGDLAICCGCKTEMCVLANFTLEIFPSV